jgi:hypothetical protein
MNGKSGAENHNRNAEKYLRDTETSYTVNLQSGLYEPYRQDRQDERNSEPAQQINSARPKGSWADWINVWVGFAIGIGGIAVSVLTLFLLILTVHYAKAQWAEMHESTIQSTRSVDAANQAIKQAHDQFISELRPFIYFASKDESGFDRDRRFWVALYPVNYGKTPAFGVRGSRKMFVGTEALKQADAWFANLEKAPHALIGSGIMPPSQSVDGYHTIISDDPILPNDPALAKDFGIVFTERLQYTDLYRTDFYQTDYCYGRLASGAVGQCPSHNKIK